ncbi:hypothetical protein GLOTRDRAFT_125498 [Gloeophyllum trabeum ATCC 11539]|uniref:Uncharacterized protein n=1 Tax=Gloeophyllum trabeum (strain ATCC 11539 / FP-39264 / Madison 617) TaxID=670483 RepID=S7S0E4_GLOTA|nr:uncharacterized protein GLOTRDRAFT_125498 [Gloeophyllum trabeum ATCC 11539]EPQ59189.1 hypothetical protein GLOTRDRAFT_125498 [Gloeophyllum trabeum ATCC 11539]
MDNTNGNHARSTYLNFVLDNQPVASYSHIPDPLADGNMNSFQYNVLVYADDTLDNGAHRLMLAVGGNGTDALMLFDYAVYSYASIAAATPSAPSTAGSSVITRSSNNLAIIIGSVLDGFLLLCVVVMAFRVWRRTRSLNRNGLSMSERLGVGP